MQASFRPIRMNSVIADQGVLFAILVRGKQSRDFITYLEAAIRTVGIATGQSRWILI
jgi:hypothetical protein